MSSREKIVNQHIDLSGRETMETVTPTRRKEYDVYECDHCGKTFTNETGTIRSGMDRIVMDHLEDEHPGELERDPYPNEDVFREWAEAIDWRVEEPQVPGDPLVIRPGEMRVVKLHESGAITLEAYRTLGGDREDEEVRLEGEDRLAVRGRQWRGGYVSRKAFPILRR